MQPNNFISISDFPTLKNIGRLQASGTIPGATTIAGAGSYTQQGEISGGLPGTSLRGRIASSLNGGVFYSGCTIAFQRTGTVLGTPTSYTVLAFVWQPSSGTIRFQFYIQNVNADPLVTQAGNDTIQFVVNTFVAPFA